MQLCQQVDFMHIVCICDHVKFEELNAGGCRAKLRVRLLQGFQQIRALFSTLKIPQIRGTHSCFSEDDSAF